jgi:hypothetical protein
MDFENDRRERGLRKLPEIVALSDCSLVVDMQRIFDVNLEMGDRQWTRFLKMSDHLIRNSIKAIVDYMQGPFFSTFNDSMYAFVPTTDVLPVEAVMKSWDNMMFENGRETDKSIIMLASNVKSSEIDEISGRVARKCGRVPEIVIREDSDDSKVIVFRSVRSF